MQANRRARLQTVILEELATVVPREVKDPRVGSVTFTRAEVTEDGEQATVYVTLLGMVARRAQAGDDPQVDKETTQAMRDCIAGLTSASGYLRRHLARAIDVRKVPTLLFREDRGLESSLRVHELLKQVAAEGSKKE
jgi:ribosome-binding factor A